MRIVATSYRSRWNSWRKHISYTFLLYIEETCSVLRAISTSAVARFIGECLITAFLAITVAMVVLSCTEPPEPWIEATAFTPIGEGMQETLQRDLGRISNATGRYDLIVAPESGIPVSWKTPLYNKKGEHACGNTAVGKKSHQVQAVYISKDEPFCPPNEVSLLHELIHALAPQADHVDDSVFSDIAHTDYLDESALLALCSYFDCLEFNPEKRAP